MYPHHPLEDKLNQPNCDFIWLKKVVPGPIKFSFMHKLVKVLLVASFSYSQQADCQDNLSADTARANIYYRNAKQLSDAFRFDSVKYWLDKARPIYLEYLGEKSVQNANVLHLEGWMYDNFQKFDLALDDYFKSLKIRKELLGEWHADMAESYNDIGYLYDERAEYDLALEYYLKSLDIFKKLEGENSYDVSLVLNNIGTVYEEISLYRRALDYFFESLNVRKALLEERNKDVAISYNNIGVVYSQMNENELALEYLFKSLAIRKELFGEMNADMAYDFNNIGTIYFDMKQYSSALAVYLKCLLIRKKVLGENNPLVATTYNNIGAAYDGLMQGDSALYYYSKALAIQKELWGEYHTDVEISYSNLGAYYLRRADFKKASEYFQKCLLIDKYLYNTKNTNTSIIYKNLGIIYEHDGKYDHALHCLQMSIANCMLGIIDTVNDRSVPVMSGYLDWNTVLTELQEKIGILTIQSGGYHDPNLNEIILKHFMACDTLIGKVRREINTQKDKLELGTLASELYSDAINICEIMKRQAGNRADKQKFDELAFNFSEKGKSTVLLEALAGQEAQKFSGIPEGMLQKESTIKARIAVCNNQLAHSESIDSASHYLLMGRLFDLNRSYDSLIRLFESQYPRYHELKYGTGLIDVAGLQKTLDEHTMMISFVVGDSMISRFAITKNSFTVKQLQKPIAFADTILALRSCLVTNEPLFHSKYLRLAYKTYALLFSDLISNAIDNLVIIPDQYLALLPFEALLTKQVPEGTSYAGMPYLIREFGISYSYSATLFCRTFPKENTRPPEIRPLNDWLALAPVFTDESAKNLTMESRRMLHQMKMMGTDSSLRRSFSIANGEYIPPLPGTEEEVKSIFSLFDQDNYKAKVELENMATEKFIKSGELKNYKILHFATHGFVNCQQPELSGILLAQDTSGGEDGILFTDEIYNLDLDASLVVLSACETGLGKIQKGEGIIGLTRALLYAGSKNIIVSLWQVADQSTSDLMVDFYKNLLNHMNNQGYAEDLRKAKLKMIAGKTFAHPFYWSPFILIGK